MVKNFHKKSTYVTTKEAWYIYAILFFIIDLMLAYFFEQQFIYSLLCFYGYSLFLTSNKIQLSLVLFLLVCENFLILGHCGFPLAYLIPAAFLAFKVKQLFAPSVLAPNMLISVCLCIQILVTEPYFFHIFFPLFYTIGKFSANIIVMILFSLKFRPR